MKNNDNIVSRLFLKYNFKSVKGLKGGHVSNDQSKIIFALME